MNASTVVAAHAAYWLTELGYRANPTTNRERVEAIYAVAAAHNATVRPSARYGKSLNIRRWLLVECNICGAAVSGSAFNLDHIDNDGHGVSGDALSHAVASGEYAATGLQFCCSNCNQDKKDDAEEARLRAKARA